MRLAREGNMIRDTLARAIRDIDECLDDATSAKVYTGAVREAVIQVRNSMRELQMVLDRPPRQVAGLGG